MIAMETKRVLFVDDDPLVGQLASATLRRRGHGVATFGDAPAALLAFRADPFAYDLLVVDLRLGNASGFDLCEAVRATRPELPVVVVSGHVGPAEEARARALGVTAILPKAEALTRLPQLLERLFG